MLIQSAMDGRSDNCLHILNIKLSDFIRIALGHICCYEVGRERLRTQIDDNQEFWPSFCLGRTGSFAWLKLSG